MDNLIVQKYGGSSLATLKQFDFVAKKVKNSLKNSNKIVIASLKTMLSYIETFILVYQPVLKVNVLC